MTSTNAVRDRPAPGKGTAKAARLARALARQAESRRQIHEKRLTDITNPLHQLSAAFGWLMAECKKRPDQIPTAYRVVLALARHINGGGSGEPDDDQRNAGPVHAR